MKPKHAFPALMASLLLASTTLAAIPAVLPVTLSAEALEPHGNGLSMRNWLINDPDYTFSEAYKTSVWYENFSSLELGSNHRNNILRIAVSQLGYHEGNSPADFDGMNTAGTGNYIEYARLLVPNYNDNAYDWCACFVNWCLNQARIDYASSEIGCWKWVDILKGMNQFEDSAAYGGDYTPRPADMIFFNWDGANTYSGHIGYVLYTTSDKVYTVEGNSKNHNVAVRSYALDDPCVIGYGTPAYEEGDEPTLDYRYTGGMPTGVYVLNAANVSLLSAIGGNSLCTIPLGARVMLREVVGFGETDYAHVTYNGTEGYIPAADLYLLTADVSLDNLTFDPNGGTGGPGTITHPVDQTCTIPAEAPTLTGDTFLGWTDKPYSCRVLYRPGDVIRPTGDGVLYAVWADRSQTLAAEAMAAGTVVEFDRPSTTTNSAALLFGGFGSIHPFDTTGGNTTVSAHTDETLGAVLALMSAKATTDPYVTLPYASLCRDLRLTATTADESDYLILRVKDISLYNILFEIKYETDGGSGTMDTMLATHGEWQYLVFDMTTASNWSGTIQSLRLDWEKTADKAGNTLLLSELFLVKGEARRDAILAGQYIYPAMPEMEQPPEVESETQVKPPPATTTQNTAPPVEPTTSDTGDTDAVTAAITTSGTTAVANGQGCASATLPAGLSAIMTLTLGGLYTALRKRKVDD